MPQGPNEMYSTLYDVSLGLQMTYDEQSENNKLLLSELNVLKERIYELEGRENELRNIVSQTTSN